MSLFVKTFGSGAGDSFGFSIGVATAAEVFSVAVVPGFAVGSTLVSSSADLAAVSIFCFAAGGDCFGSSVGAVTVGVFSVGAVAGFLAGSTLELSVADFAVELPANPTAFFVAVVSATGEVPAAVPTVVVLIFLVNSSADGLAAGVRAF